MTPASIPLLEPEELDLGLDAVEEVEAHGGGVCVVANEVGCGCLLRARRRREVEIRIGMATMGIGTGDLGWMTILSHSRERPAANWLFSVLFQIVTLALVDRRGSQDRRIALWALAKPKTARQAANNP